MGVCDIQRSTEMAAAVYWPISTTSDYPTATAENQLELVIFLSPVMTEFSENLHFCES